MCLQHSYTSLFIVFVDDTTEDLKGILHGRETAVLIVTMVDTGVAIATDLDVKASCLEVSYQWQTASDGVGLALTKNIFSGSVEVRERRGIQVDSYALHRCSE